MLACDHPGVGLYQERPYRSREKSLSRKKLESVSMAPSKKKGATGSSSSANKLCFQRLQKELRAIEQNPSCLQGMHCSVNPVGP